MATHYYNVETLSKLSGWPSDEIEENALRNGLDVSRLPDAVIWLASNGIPDVRAEMAKRLLHSIVAPRRTINEHRMSASKMNSCDLILEIFKDDAVGDSRSNEIKRRSMEAM